MAFSFRDEYPVLGPAATLDENLTTGQVVQGQNAKIPGAWAEIEAPIDAATAVSRVMYTAPYPVQVIGFSVRFSTAGGAAAAVTLEKTPSGTAPGSGTALLTGTVSLTGTVNTNTPGTLIAAATTRTLATGDSLSLVFSGTQTGLVGLAAQIILQKV